MQKSEKLTQRIRSSAYSLFIDEFFESTFLWILFAVMWLGSVGVSLYSLFFGDGSKEYGIFYLLAFAFTLTIVMLLFSHNDKSDD